MCRDSGVDSMGDSPDIKFKPAKGNAPIYGAGEFFIHISLVVVISSKAVAGLAIVSSISFASLSLLKSTSILFLPVAGVVMMTDSSNGWRELCGVKSGFTGRVLQGEILLLWLRSARLALNTALCVSLSVHSACGPPLSIIIGLGDDDLFKTPGEQSIGDARSLTIGEKAKSKRGDAAAAGVTAISTS